MKKRKELRELAGGGGGSTLLSRDWQEQRPYEGRAEEGCVGVGRAAGLAEHRARMEGIPQHEVRQVEEEPSHVGKNRISF